MSYPIYTIHICSKYTQSVWVHPDQSENIPPQLHAIAATSSSDPLTHVIIQLIHNTAVSSNGGDQQEVLLCFSNLKNMATTSNQITELQQKMYRDFFHRYLKKSKACTSITNATKVNSRLIISELTGASKTAPGQFP